jgi:lipopolysaccharide export system permease protein
VFGILYRMIFWELVKVFALSLIGITGILVLAGIVAEASQQGLGPAQVLAIIPLLIPSTLPYTIPATTLFASCVVYGRLAADNEILAIKAAGINILKVVRPVALLGLLMSGVTMAMYYAFIPTTHHVLRSMVIQDVEECLYAYLKKDGQIKQPGLTYYIWVQRVQGRRLLGAVFKQCAKKGGYDLVALAKEAELRYDPNRREVLVHMRSVDVYKEQEGSPARVHFDNRVWPVELPPFDKARKRRPREMTWQEVLLRQDEVREQQEKLATQIALASAQVMITQPPTQLLAFAENLKQQVRGQELEMNSLDAELHMRPAISLGCLFFVLIGCPVGIWFGRSDYLSSFITCFLPIVCLYYPLLLCGTNLAKDGRVAPSIAVWAADGVMALGAFVLFRRLVRH